MAILVTGGAGYIGSHTVVELQNAGFDVVVLDNLSNASEKALDRVTKITEKPVKFYKVHIAKLNGRICGAKRPHSVSEQPKFYQSM